MFISTLSMSWASTAALQASLGINCCTVPALSDTAVISQNRNTDVNWTYIMRFLTRQNTNSEMRANGNTYI